MRVGPPPEGAQHLEQLGQNASQFFGQKFKNSVSMHGTYLFTFPNGDRLYFLRKVYFDEHVGVLYRVIVIDDLGKNEHQLDILAQYRFDDIRQFGSKPVGEKIPFGQMPISPRLFFYTNRFCGSIENMKDIFLRYQQDVYIEVIDESQMHKTLFISYGTPNQEMASRINQALKSRGVQTWFFPDDHVPGEKLHRMMSEAVNKYDRTLLVCSKDSVIRGGVLNEIERLLEREAAEGGADIIIPVALDDYIFNEWQPEREDIKRQITSRVVCKINEDNFDSEIERILAALQR